MLPLALAKPVALVCAKVVRVLSAALTTNVVVPVLAGSVPKLPAASVLVTVTVYVPSSLTKVLAKIRLAVPAAASAAVTVWLSVRSVPLGAVNVKLSTSPVLLPLGSVIWYCRPSASSVWFTPLTASAKVSTGAGMAALLPSGFWPGAWVSSVKLVDALTWLVLPATSWVVTVTV